ncbi:MAG: acyl-CoA dehydrogenase family protein [Solirubrobacterales bacterium]
MDFGFNDEQQAIRDTAREMLSKRSPLSRVREHAEAGTRDEELWGEICGLGWPGISIAEEHGGQGLGTIELAILCEELGYSCAAVPFLSNAFAGILIEGNGTDEQKSKWLPGIASGEGRGAAAFEPSESATVIDGDGASVLVLAPCDHGEQGVISEPSQTELTPIDLIDTTRSYARSKATGGDPLPSDALEHLARGGVAIAAEMVGIAQRAMEMAVSYAKEREQFGRPIGAYQAVSHRCAEMLWDVEEARSLTLYAAWCADAQPESLPQAAHMAKARASDSAWAVTASALQVLGGIGFTWEHDLQFLLKRAKTDAALLGPAGAHRDRVAGFAGLGAA